MAASDAHLFQRAHNVWPKPAYVEPNSLSQSSNLGDMERGSALAMEPYVGNPGFGIHCPPPLDSVNPGFIWRAPLVKPLDSFRFTYRDS